jgi:hypothetical protein
MKSCFECKHVVPFRGKNCVCNNKKVNPAIFKKVSESNPTNYEVAVASKCGCFEQK